MAYRVGVVGCGVAGATVAYLLAKQGHAVTVVEQAPELHAYGAGILLQATGQAVLEHLGLKAEVLARAAPLDDLYARHANGRELITNRYADFDPGCRAYGVHRGVVFGAILRLMQTQNVDLRLGRRVVGRANTAADTTLLDDRGERHGPFDFVLAADGARSAFRKVCHLPARVHKYAHGTLWIIAPSAGVPGKLLQVVRGTDRLFGLMPMGDGLCTLYWGLPLRDFAKLKARGLEALKKEILQFAPEAAPVLDFVCDFDQMLLTSYQHVYMPRTSDARTLFLGDAAHAMSPHLGQGLNLALLDAYRFAECLKESRSPRDAFARFHARQTAYLRYYAAVTFFLSPFFQSDNWLLGWGRDLTLPLLPKIPWVRRQMLMTVCGLKGGFFGGRMVV